MYVTDLLAGIGSGPTLRKFTITYADFAGNSAGSGVAAPITLFSLTQGSKIMGVTIQNTINFAGGAISALTCAVGYSGTPAAFSAAYSLFATASNTTYQDTAVYGRGAANSITAFNVTATFTPTSDKVANLTSGQVDIYVLFTDVSTPTSTASPV